MSEAASIDALKKRFGGTIKPLNPKVPTDKALRYTGQSQKAIIEMIKHIDGRIFSQATFVQLRYACAFLKLPEPRRPAT